MAALTRSMTKLNIKPVITDKNGMLSPNPKIKPQVNLGARVDTDYDSDDLIPAPFTTGYANTKPGARPKSKPAPKPKKPQPAAKPSTSQPSASARQEPSDPVHPYIDKTRKYVDHISRYLKNIVNLSDNDMILCNRKTGANNYKPNLDYADTLDCVAKNLLDFSTKISQNAQKIRDKVDNCQNVKDHMQDLFVIGQYTVSTLPKPDNKSLKRLALSSPKAFVVKQENCVQYGGYVSDSPCESEDEAIRGKPRKKKQKVSVQPPEPGNPDTKFLYLKTNSNSTENFICNMKGGCGKKFRDSSELNNHLSTHQHDLFRCMKCYEIFRSADSFQRHHDVHTGTAFICKVCTMQFGRKTSLTNHMQKHSDLPAVVCTTCDREFTYRQNGIEHIQWFHRPTKDCLCPICKKRFQMPTYMRAHKLRRHGPVTKLVHPSV